MIAPRPAPAELGGLPGARRRLGPGARSSPSGLPTGEVEALLARLRARRRPRGVAVRPRARRALAARRASGSRRRGLPDRHAELPRPALSRAARPGRDHRRVAVGATGPRARRPDPRPVLGRAGRAGGPRHTPDTRRGHAGSTPRCSTPTGGPTPATRALRRTLAPHGEVLVGYVGRLAPEKELHRLAGLAGLPGVRVVLVGDGRAAATDAALLDAAGLDGVLLGRREGDDLARAYAALDVFVHTGTRETFGQTLQEAAATALPVVAPGTGWTARPRRPQPDRAAVRPRRSRAPCARRWRTSPATAPSGRRWARRGGSGSRVARGPPSTDELLGHYATARAHARSDGPRRGGYPLVTRPVWFLTAGPCALHLHGPIT